MTRGTLYISSRQPGHEASVVQAEMALKTRYGSDFSLEVVDVIEDPDRADEAHVVATPLLIVENGTGTERFIGSLDAAAHKL